MSYADVILSSNPVAWWRLGESSGIVATDSSGNGHHGTYAPNTGGAWAGGTQGVSGATADGNKAARPSVGYVDLGAPFSPGTSQMSIELWVKSNGAVNSFAISSRSSASSGGYELLIGSGSTPNAWEFRFGNPSTTTTGPINGVPLDVYHHAVMVFTGSQVNYYMDGGFLVNRSYSSSITSSQNLMIARRGATIGLNGDVDEVSIYNYALTPEQITAHYTAATTPEETDRRLFGSRLFGSKLFGGTL